MKALNLYGKQDVRYEDVEIPVIEHEDDIIIKVKTAGICGSDISRFGKIGSYNPGLTWGHEFSGVIAETGKGVKSLKKGDRVTACPCFPCYECEFCRQGKFSKCTDLKVLGGHKKGAFAEYIKIPEANVIKIPDNMDYDTASLIEPSCVVVHGYNQVNIKAGDSVAVVGCGTIGLLAVQWAKIFGAAEVFAFDTDSGKLEVAKNTGADHIFNVTEEGYFQKFMELTGNRGVNTVVESSGNVSGIANSFSMAVKGGTVLLLGIPYGDVLLPRENFEKIIRNELEVAGSWNSISAPFPGKEWDTALGYMSKGMIDVKPLITHKIALGDAPEMFWKLYGREAFFIKVLMEVDGDE
ncbi:galactitol-1-phosphate 5-dehydrogenase [Sebaldella sp. S0638]|uniref:galactitol-1-phosphate 5-dehydrogenase n=1 Tax=Sebaldella sp. S0638 TaxID=2957809 RepID=UPI00209C809D|nr:galactitol-1-phosphate 5-dehydrogenase [Sebaldella sp. S0638]MCP1223155.1 galactitol-1-phosphate 5-dehydrogenase [Sebaldella sp. S0638]